MDDILKEIMKRLTEDKLLKKYKRAFYIHIPTAWPLYMDFKTIGRVKSDKEGAWYAYMIEKDLVCLRGIGMSDKIPRGNLDLESKLNDKFNNYIDDYLAKYNKWPSKKESMQNTIKLLKDYYKEIMELDENKEYSERFTDNIEPIQISFFY